jgi:hypothetical protein
VEKEGRNWVPFPAERLPRIYILTARSKKKNARKVLALGRLLTEVPSQHCTMKYKFVKGMNSSSRWLTVQSFR